MQESGSYINPYYGATSQNTFGNSGSDSPTATLALAAYYGSGAGFGAGAGSASGAGMAGYASYYNNLVAGYYPSHQSSYSSYSAGSAASGGVPSSGSHPDEYGRRPAPGPVYHLNTEHLNTLSPPSIAEPGTNSLDDVLKPPSKQNLFLFRIQAVHFMNS